MDKINIVSSLYLAFIFQYRLNSAFSLFHMVTRYHYCVILSFCVEMTLFLDLISFSLVAGNCPC